MTTRPRRKLTIDVDDDDVWETLQATAREHQWALAKLGKLILRDYVRHTGWASGQRGAV